MPNRIIKESICTSDSIDRLSWMEECFFYRLMVSCDDFGRMDARPAILRSRTMPLKSVTDKQIANMLESLRTADMIDLYVVDGHSYLQLRTWERHQQIRAKKSKYPAPDSNGYHLISNDIKCPRNPIQSESESESESESVLLHGAPASGPPCQNAIITLTLNDKSEYPIYEEQTHEWAALYPAVDVIQQLREMKGWLSANPTKRKTKKGVLRFVHSWLAREQDRGCFRSQKKAPKSFSQLAAEMEDGS